MTTLTGNKWSLAIEACERGHSTCRDALARRLASVISSGTLAKAYRAALEREGFKAIPRETVKPQS